MYLPIPIIAEVNPFGLEAVQVFLCAAIGLLKNIIRWRSSNRFTPHLTRTLNLFVMKLREYKDIMVKIDAFNIINMEKFIILIFLIGAV